MAKFSNLISKEGETISHYVHSFESSRDSVTNLKESKWAAATNITAIVRSQPEALTETPMGVYEAESIVILTETAIAEHDVIKWNNKYYDIVMVEEMWFRKALDYYKGTCVRRIEFLGE
jgi:hypothetical protein